MRSTLVLFVLAVAATSSRAEELIKLDWVVAPDGSTWVWPNDKYPVEERRPAPWFDYGLFGDDGKFASILPRGGTFVSLLVLLPGTVDRASLTDAGHHFKQLKLGLSDAQIVARIAAEPESKWGPALRRARLDRILAVRIAGARKLKTAVAALKAIGAMHGSDPFLRQAAAESIARIESTPLQAVRVPEPESVLDNIPSDAQIVMLIDQRKVTRWRRPWRLVHDYGVRIARLVIQALGGSVSDMDLASGEVNAQIPLEFGYEMARQFGNHTRQWSVWAVRTPKGEMPVSVWGHMAGRFELEPLRQELRRAGIRNSSEAGIDEIRAAIVGQDSMLTVRENELTFQMGQLAQTGSIAEELVGAGMLKGAAVWIHVRDPAAFKPLGPMLMGVESLTIRVSFEGGVDITIDAVCKDKNTARGIKPLVKTMLMQAWPDLAELARMVRVKLSDNRVRVSFRAEGKTLEDLIEEITKQA